MSSSMVWIVAAVPSKAGPLSAAAEADFHEVAKSNAAAPWRLETGHLRAGREILEEMTGRSWEEVDLTPGDVQADYDRLSGEERYAGAKGLQAALIAFLGVCAKHGCGLEGGVGARRMRR